MYELVVWIICICESRKGSLYIFFYWLKIVLEFFKNEYLMYGFIRKINFVIRDRLFREDFGLSFGFLYVYYVI